MSNPNPTFLTQAPTVIPIAQMAIHADGLQELVNWVRELDPDSVSEVGTPFEVFPHKGLRDPDDALRGLLSGNELLVELSGRKCYNSFGTRAGRKTNHEYIQNTQAGDIPHASIMYHAKMSFFVAGISRRVSHELIRHYVGADRDEEGSPSQESTRYVEHSGRYIVHPRLLTSGNEEELAFFRHAMTTNRHNYNTYIEMEFQRLGGNPKGMDRKRIFESASAFLSHSAETSFIWTTNPIALAKMVRERDNEAADLEIQRLARTWRDVAVTHWPNLFPQPWMQSPQP